MANVDARDGAHAPALPNPREESSASGGASQWLDGAHGNAPMCVNTSVSNIDRVRRLLRNETAVVDFTWHAALAVPTPIVEQHVGVVDGVGHVEQREREVKLRVGRCGAEDRVLTGRLSVALEASARQRWVSDIVDAGEPICRAIERGDRTWLVVDEAHVACVIGAVDPDGEDVVER